MRFFHLNCPNKLTISASPSAYNLKTDWLFYIYNAMRMPTHSKSNSFTRIIIISIKTNNSCHLFVYKIYSNIESTLWLDLSIFCHLFFANNNHFFSDSFFSSLVFYLARYTRWPIWRLQKLHLNWQCNTEHKFRIKWCDKSLLYFFSLFISPSPQPLRLVFKTKDHISRQSTKYPKTGNKNSNKMTKKKININK